MKEKARYYTVIWVQSIGFGYQKITTISVIRTTRKNLKERVINDFGFGNVLCLLHGRPKHVK